MKNRLRQFSIILSILLIYNFVNAQDYCGTQLHNKELQDQGIAYPSTPAFEKWIKKKTAERKARDRMFKVEEDTIYIPVVVHVIHKGELLGRGANISDEQIISQIEVLNEDFQRLNPDRVNTPKEFEKVAAGLPIKFVLAKQDPKGYPTNGIVRVKGSKDVWQVTSGGNMDPQGNRVFKAESYWPAEDYMNIWVADLAPMEDGKVLLGYAQFPEINLDGIRPWENQNRLTDGVAMDYTVFGSKAKGDFSEIKNLYALGRTTTHEVGHYFGLLHIWGEGEFDTCLSDDYVDDTPNASGSNAHCPAQKKACDNISRAMIENYMDYTPDECMNLFTKGQFDRAMTVIEYAPRRASLANSHGLVPSYKDFVDLAIKEMSYPYVISCVGEVNPVIELENLGTLPIDDIQVMVFVSDELQYVKDMSIHLSKGEAKIIELPIVYLNKGFQNLDIQVVPLSEQSDLTVGNNIISASTVASEELVNVPYRQRFNADNFPFLGWQEVNPDKKATWELVPLEYSGTNDRALKMPFYQYSGDGNLDYLVSPSFDFTDWDKVSVSMKISYAYDSRSGKVDRLRLLGISDCGGTIEELWSSNSRIFAKQVDLKGEWVPLSDNDWLLEKIDGSGLIGKKEVRFVLEAKNGEGNNLYIDDFEIYNSDTNDIKDVGKFDFIIYPNPVYLTNRKNQYNITASGKFKLAINSERAQPVVISVLTSLGQVVYKKKYENVLNQTFEIDIFGFSPGIYWVNVSGKYFSKSKNFSISP